MAKIAGSVIADPIVSIIMVTYNAAAYLTETLASVGALKAASACSKYEVELVVVDGDSKDGTTSAIAASGLADVFISEPDLGIYDAMNKGVRLGHGRWLHFLNAGDYITDVEGYLALLQKLNGENDVDFWVSGAVNLGGGKREGTVIRNLPHSVFRHLIGLQSHCHQACWFRRDRFLALGGYDLRLGTAADYALIVQFGLIRDPGTMNRMMIGYLGGGISETSAWKTQVLLHKVRKTIFQMNPFMRGIDLTAAYAVAAANSSRISVGRLRRRVLQAIMTRKHQSE